MELLSAKKRILVLDKDSRMLPVVDEIMNYGDFDIHILYDANAVYDKAKQINPDLIILDYLLLDNDCEMICQDFKNDNDLEAIPIIIVTAFNNRKATADSYKCDALFVKPLDMRVLATRIDYLIAS
jgi:DNA-binding response OmpR family regulator